MSWREFWNHPHSIYVNERHRLLHYGRIAKDIAALIPSPDSIMLDYGCGEAMSADDTARQCRHLYLFDTAPSVQDKLRRRFASEPKITVLDEAGFLGLADAGLGIVVCNSVLQYLRADETARLILIWHDKLKPGGRLILGDVIPPDLNAIGDVKALLHFAWQGGFMIAALKGLVATFFSNYRKLRDEIGLTTYSEDDMLSLLSAHGFKAEQAAQNIGHHQARMTFIATKM
jgi:SAM-dependent methyltransferase